MAFIKVQSNKLNSASNAFMKPKRRHYVQLVKNGLKCFSNIVNYIKNKTIINKICNYKTCWNMSYENMRT